MPEIIEISGLEDIDQEARRFSPQASNSIRDTLFVLGAGVGVVLLLGVLIPSLFGRRKQVAALADLGVIVPCRTKDMKPDRPRAAQKWCLWTQDKKRILGRHPTYEGALRQERLIEMKKRGFVPRRG